MNTIKRTILSRTTRGTALALLALAGLAGGVSLAQSNATYDGYSLINCRFFLTNDPSPHRLCNHLGAVSYNQRGTFNCLSCAALDP